MRCGKEIPHPNALNADYIIASEFVVAEPRDIICALTHNDASKTKLVDDPEAIIDDEELDVVEVPDVAYGRTVPDMVKVIVKAIDKDIQKTAVICPDCFHIDTDFVIWGVHRKES